MTDIVLKPGDKITITLQGTDGEFEIEYGKTALTVTADMPDTQGREGVIYSEEFGGAGGDVDESIDADEDDTDVDESNEPPEENLDPRPIMLNTGRGPRPIGMWHTPKRTLLYPRDRRYENYEWIGSVVFLRILRLIESKLTPSVSRGLEACPVCGKHSVIGEYELGGWTWSVSLIHSVEEHAAITPIDFVRFIEKEANMLLVGGRTGASRLYSKSRNESGS